MVLTVKGFGTPRFTYPHLRWNDVEREGFQYSMVHISSSGQKNENTMCFFNQSSSYKPPNDDILGTSVSIKWLLFRKQNR